MQTKNSIEHLQQLQQQTEQLLDIAIRQWQMVHPATFKQQPAPGSWSAMQCLGHLNAYGDYYLPAIEKALYAAKEKRQPASEHFTPGWLGGYFTKLMLPDEKGKPARKMKAPKSYTTSNEGDSDATIAKFIDHQEKLLKLLDEAKEVNINTIRIPISIARFIKLKLGDTFAFLVAHNLRHVRQAERAIAAADTKANATPQTPSGAAFIVA